MQNQSKLPLPAGEWPRGSVYKNRSIMGQEKMAGRIMKNYNQLQMTSSNIYVSSLLSSPIRLTATCLPLLLLIENFQPVEMKGLVGKLPGNPASCPEEPCNSDPQQVLYALKWASLFFGCALMCPLFGYGLYKIWLKLKSLCGGGRGASNKNATGQGGGKNRSSSRGKQLNEKRARKGLSLEDGCQSRSSSSSRATSSSSPESLMASGVAGEKYGSQLSGANLNTKQKKSSLTVNSMSSGHSGQAQITAADTAPENAISTSNNWHQAPSGAGNSASANTNGLLTYRESVQLNPTSSPLASLSMSMMQQQKQQQLQSSQNAKRVNALSQQAQFVSHQNSDVSNGQENFNHQLINTNNGLGVGGNESNSEVTNGQEQQQQQRIFDEVSEMALNKQLAELLSNSNEVLQQRQHQRQLANQQQFEQQKNQQRNMYPNVIQHRYSMFVGRSSGSVVPEADCRMSLARIQQQQPQNGRDANDFYLNPEFNFQRSQTSMSASASTSTKRGKSRGLQAANYPSGKRKVHPAPADEPEIIGGSRFMDRESGTRDNVNGSEQNFATTTPINKREEDCDMVMRSSGHSIKLKEKLEHQQQQRYYNQLDQNGNLLTLPFDTEAFGQHRHSIDGSLLNNSGDNDSNNLSFSHLQIMTQVIGGGRPEAATIQLSSPSSSSGNNNLNPNGGSNNTHTNGGNGIATDGQGRLCVGGASPVQMVSRSGSERHHRRASSAIGSAAITSTNAPVNVVGSGSSKRPHISNANRLVHSYQQQQQHKQQRHKRQQEQQPPDNMMMTGQQHQQATSGNNSGGQLLMLDHRLNQRDRRPSLKALT